MNIIEISGSTEQTGYRPLIMANRDGLRQLIMELEQIESETDQQTYGIHNLVDHDGKAAPVAVWLRW